MRLDIQWRARHPLKMTGPGEYWDSSANWIIKIIFCANGFITFDSRGFFSSGVAEDISLRIEGSRTHGASHITDVISKN